MPDYAAALLDQDRQFADQLKDQDWSTPVPTCPGWAVTQLMRHLGRGHRWAAQIIREKRDTHLNPREVENGKPPADESGAIDWLRESSPTLLAAVEATGADTPVWTFLGPRPAAWWIRRRLHETTVHRADLAIALGVPFTLDPELAGDGISEWIDLIVAETGPGQRGHDSVEPGISVHLHATDTEAEWTLRGGPDGVTQEAVHAKSTTAVRGSASDLLLALTGRRPVAETGAEIYGDATVWQTFLERTPLI